MRILESYASHPGHEFWRDRFSVGESRSGRLPDPPERHFSGRNRYLCFKIRLFYALFSGNWHKLALENVGPYCCSVGRSLQNRY
jgi:hypothetical protein